MRKDIYYISEPLCLPFNGDFLQAMLSRARSALFREITMRSGVICRERLVHAGAFWRVFEEAGGTYYGGALQGTENIRECVWTKFSIHRECWRKRYFEPVDLWNVLAYLQVLKNDSIVLGRFRDNQKNVPRTLRIYQKPSANFLMCCRRFFLHQECYENISNC